MPTDRLIPEDIRNRLPQPEVKIILDGNAIYKPGMRTFFADGEETGRVHAGGEAAPAQEAPAGGQRRAPASAFAAPAATGRRSQTPLPSRTERTKTISYTICTCNTVLVNATPTPRPTARPTAKPTARPGVRPTTTTYCSCNTQSYTNTYCSCDLICTCNLVYR